MSVQRVADRQLRGQGTEAENAPGEDILQVVFGRVTGYES